MASTSLGGSLAKIASPVRTFLRSAITGDRPVVPVLRFSGPIGMATPLRPGVSLATSATSIERAFSTPGAKAVAVQINSPGGSPVQSVLIFRRLRALSREKNLPVFVFAEDVAASGGYLIALAGDEIYVDRSSIVGSIGVISAGFGFTGLIDKIGVERRVHTAGESKMTLDPFQPEKQEDVERLMAIQRDVHEMFKDLVRERRGAKLSAADGDIFTGAFWAGGRAKELGLVDGLGDLRTVMREKFGDRVHLKLIQPPKSLFRRLRGMRSGNAGPGLIGGISLTGWADEALSTVEARALWSRYGL